MKPASPSAGFGSAASPPEEVTLRQRSHYDFWVAKKQVHHVLTQEKTLKTLERHLLLHWIWDPHFALPQRLCSVATNDTWASNNCCENEACVPISRLRFCSFSAWGGDIKAKVSLWLLSCKETGSSRLNPRKNIEDPWTAPAATLNLRPSLCFAATPVQCGHKWHMSLSQLLRKWSLRPHQQASIL